MDVILSNLIQSYVDNPDDEFINFDLGVYYESIGQTASAVSYFLRCAERASKKELSYECLLRASICFNKQGSRNFTVQAILQNAISTCPERPEGYYLLSKFYEHDEADGHWNSCYLISCIGQKMCEDKIYSELKSDVGYPGYYSLIFQRAVSSWWCGLCDESRKLFLHLKDSYEMDQLHNECTDNNLKMLEETSKNLHAVYYNSKNSDPDFSWGDFGRNKWLLNSIEKEFCSEEVNYEKFFKVEENDVVVDIGASVGPFSYSILNRNPKKVYCIEPHEKLFETLKQNLSKSDNVIFINKAISNEDGIKEVSGIYNDKLDEHYTGDLIWRGSSETSTMSFKTFIEENNISKIDFLKTDCEGGEYDIFTDDNLNWIVNNVRKIAGEWHFHNEELKDKFKKFRDTYLKALKNYQVYFVDYDSNFTDVTDKIWTEEFIQSYGWVNLYIDNQNSNTKPTKKWKNAIAPTLEFTTSIPVKGCVVDCVFCPQRTLEKVYDGERYMSLDNFKKVIDKLPKEIRVTFAGFTEPWLNKYTTDMVLYAHEQGHPISIFTTGIGMNVSDIEKIKHIPFAGGPNGGFVLHLPDSERKAKHPITKRYIDVIEHFGKIHGEIQNFTIMAMGPIHEDVSHVFQNAPVYDMWSRAGNLLGESILKPELLNIKNLYKSIYHGENPMTCGCYEGLYHNVLLPNGDVSLCCMDYGLKHILGNLYEQEYEDVVPVEDTCFDLCKFCENAKCPSKVL